MALYEEMIHSGNRLFRYRSFIPLVLYVFAAAAIFLSPHNYFYHGHLWWQIVCLAVSISGLIIRVMTIGHTPRGTSGRNTQEGQVAEQLNTRGMYSLVRHPLYLGNFLMWLGLIIYAGSLWFTVLAVLFFWIYYERIMLAEESFIRSKFGQTYEDWASGVPAFIPRRFRWMQPQLSFSWKNVLKREYSGFFAIFLSFSLVDVMKNYSSEGIFRLHDFWVAGLVVSAFLFVLLRSLKKYSHVLEVEGR